MRKKILSLSLAAAALLCAPSAFAADHLDAPGAVADPAADITDVYTWVEGSKVVMVLNVTPSATTSSKFSDTVQYVLHTTSGPSFGMTTSSLDFIATFDASQTIQLWAGSADYVTGDASATAGLSSASGRVKVFAGLRDDPFFFNLDGFKVATSTVAAAAPGLTFDGTGCPAVDASTSAAVVGLLKSDGVGGAGKNFFAGLNVLSIVVEVDKTLVADGGDAVSVWASTHKKP